MSTNLSFTKTYGCLLGGLIGDAMGTPTEMKDYREIEERFGWVADFEGDGTDDSLLKYFLCDALIKTNGYATADDWANIWLNRNAEVFGDKVDKFFISVLHTFEKLKSTSLTPREVSQGNMPSSSSAMCIAPVGIVNACNPRAASLQAQDLASLIHTGAVSFCQDGAASVAAAIAAAFDPEATVATVIDAATAYLKPLSGREMVDLIRKAVAMAKEEDDYQIFRKRYHENFRCAIPCDSRETVPAAIALFYLSKGEPSQAIPFAANFGRDTDTIATIVGAISGAFKGAEAIPAAWIEKTKDCRPNQQELARILENIALMKAKTEQTYGEKVLALDR